MRIAWSAVVVRRVFSSLLEGFVRQVIWVRGRGCRRDWICRPLLASRIRTLSPGVRRASREPEGEKAAWRGLDILRDLIRNRSAQRDGRIVLCAPLHSPTW